jgi:hypothetical protein
MSERRRSHDGGSEESEPPSDEGETGPRPFIDGVFEALADWRRREVCQFFRETDASAATVEELAMLLVGCQPSGAGDHDDLSHEELAVGLRERHLPLLDAAGVVDYDDRSSTVRYWGQPTVEKWLEHVSAVDRFEQ